MKKRLLIIVAGSAAVFLSALFFGLLSLDHIPKPSASREGRLLSPVELASDEKIKVEYTSSGCRSWCSWYFELDGGNSARLVVVDAGGSYDAGVSGPKAQSPVGVVQLTARERRGLRDLLEFYRSVPEQELGTTQNRIKVEYYHGTEKVGSEVFVEGGMAEYLVYRKDQPESSSEDLDPRVTAEMVSFRSLFQRAWQEANQSLEPMARSVTPSAGAEVAPALAMAHH